MIPILYSPTETNFTHNGIGHLVECVSCEVTEERNGAFELVLEYPVNGRYFGSIVKRAVIKARADDTREPQLFRVYGISKPLKGIVTVKAAHISYDLTGTPVRPFTANSAAEAMQGLKDSAVVASNPFRFETDVPTLGTFAPTVPASARAMLGGIEKNILSVYGGELEFDNFTVRLHAARGRDRGVAIRYGKNLTDLQQDENCANIYSGIYPYWQRTETVDNKTVQRYVDLDGEVCTATWLPSDFERILIVDFSNEFDAPPTADQLREKASAYIEENNIGVPDVSLTVSFVLLHQTEEYKELVALETVSLCDTVTVIFPALNVNAQAQVVKVVWDTLRDRYKAVALGTVKPTVADLLAAQNSAIKAAQSGSIGAGGNLNATDINLYGSFTVRSGDAIGGRLGYMSGLSGDGSATNGIGMSNADGSCYVIVTDGGVRLQAGDTKLVVTPSGCTVNGTQIG